MSEETAKYVEYLERMHAVLRGDRKAAESRLAAAEEALDEIRALTKGSCSCLDDVYYAWQRQPSGGEG